MNVPDLPFLTAEQEEQLEDTLEALSPMVQEAFRDRWEDMGEDVQKKVLRAAKYAGRLSLRSIRGEDVAYGRRQLNATLGSLAYAITRRSITTILEVVESWWKDVVLPKLRVMAQEVLELTAQAAVAWIREELAS